MPCSDIQAATSLLCPIALRTELIRRNFAGQALASYLHLTFKHHKFKSMNVEDMIPASARAADLMRSLSHPQRLLVLCALGREEKSVGQLRQEIGGIEQVPMSQQLMRLRSDGLVTSRREGTTVFYRIEKPEVIDVVEALHAAFCGVQAVPSRAAASSAKHRQKAARR
jgi:ArsR family transcriptional regulator